MFSSYRTTTVWKFISFSTVDEAKSAEIGGLDYLESPVSDGTIEENFEAELVNAPVTAFNSIHSLSNYDDDDEDEDEDFSDVSQYGIVEVVGDDTYGRKIITVTACKLPNNAHLDHQRLLRLEKGLFCNRIEFSVEERQPLTVVTFKSRVVRTSCNSCPANWHFAARKL